MFILQNPSTGMFIGRNDKLSKRPFETTFNDSYKFDNEESAKRYAKDINLAYNLPEPITIYEMQLNEIKYDPGETYLIYQDYFKERTDKNFLD